VRFFVLIISFSVPDTERLKIVAGSMRDAFGFQREMVVTGMVEIEGNPRYQYARGLVPLPVLDLVGPIPEDSRDIEALSEREAAFERLREIVDPYILDWPARDEEVVAERAASSEDQRFARIETELRQAIQAVPELERLAENLEVEKAPEGAG
jgi:chemotaxis protein MotB